MPPLVTRATVDVRVPIEVVVVVHIDIVVSPAGIPAPPAAPRRTHRDPDAKRDGRASRIRPHGRVVNRRIRVHRRSVHYDRVVGGDVHHLRVRLFNHVDVPAFNQLCFYHLFRRGFQIAGALCLDAHALHGLHHIRFLRQKGVAELSRPLDVVCQALDDVRERGHRLDARIPWLLGDLLGKELLVLL